MVQSAHEHGARITAHSTNDGGETLEEYCRWSGKFDIRLQYYCSSYSTD